MRIFVNDITVLERSRLGFVGVTDQIHWPFFVQFDEAPLQAARKTCSTAPAQSGVFDFVDDLGARHRQRLFQLFVSPGTKVAIDVSGPIIPPDVLENQPMFQWMWRGLMFDLPGLISKKLRW